MKVKITRIPACSLTLLSLALLGLPLGSSAQTGTAKAAAYECSGLEGAALTSCRDLNAAAAKSAAITTNPSKSHDCSGMIGGSLTTCMDLNGQLPQILPNGSGAGQPSPMPSGSTAGQAQTLPTGSPAGQAQTLPSQSTAGQAPAVQTDVAGDAQPQAGSGQITTSPSSANTPAVPGSRAPDAGRVPPPSDKIIPITEGSRAMSATPSAPVSAPPDATIRSAPALAK